MFDNSCITPLRKHKPHIVLIDGYWRVSKLHKPYINSVWWNHAHAFITRLNSEQRPNEA